MALYSITILSLCLFMIHYWIKRKHNYWKVNGVQGPTPLPIVGNYGRVLTSKESIGGLAQRVYNTYPDEKVVGIYRGLVPVLVIRDPELLKQVLVKDFNTFQDRTVKTADEFDDNLFRVGGEKWRLLRERMTPLFTSGKLKKMMPLVENCAQGFIRYVDDLVDKNNVHEFRDLAARYTLAVICSCAFGVDVDCFNDKANAYKDISDVTFAPPFAIRMMRFIDFVVPGFQDMMYKLNIVDVNAEQRTFFLTLTNEIIQKREGKLKTRHDFMDLMIELKEQGIQNRHSMKLELSANLMAAQAFVFQAAGMESSSISMSLFLHELCLNQDIQDRVYEEICDKLAKHNGKVTYESLNEMSYLEMCIDETLRKYPVVMELIRKSGSDYQFPGLKLKIKKGTGILISAMAIQNDPQHYPRPEVFDPERFSPQNKAARPPCTYLPFGVGPRHCIGLRFAKLQTMIGLVAFLRKFKVNRCEKTEAQLKFNPKGLLLTPENGLWVKITKR